MRNRFHVFVDIAAGLLLTALLLVPPIAQYAHDSWARTNSVKHHIAVTMER